MKPSATLPEYDRYLTELLYDPNLLKIKVTIFLCLTQYVLLLQQLEKLTSYLKLTNSYDAFASF